MRRFTLGALVGALVGVTVGWLYSESIDRWVDGIGEVEVGDVSRETP